MCNVSKLLKFILFADDTTIFNSYSNLSDLVTELNTQLSKMCKWFCVNKLSLYNAKINNTLFGRYTNQQNVVIIITNVIIRRVQTAKFPGVLVDKSLNWKNHINLVKSKLAKIDYVRNKVKHCVDHSELVIVFTSLDVLF